MSFVGYPIEKKFGDFGGLFMSDIFTLFMEDLALDIKHVLNTNGFFLEYDKTLDLFSPEEIRFQEITLQNNKTVFMAQSQALMNIMAGHLAIAKCLDIKTVCAGVTSIQQAYLLAKVCSELNIHLMVFLGRGISQDEILLKKIEELGCEIDTEKCETLFDNPSMYAFLAFNSKPKERYFLPLFANIGPYPFPSLTSIFACRFGSELLGNFPSSIDCIAVPINTGTNALGIFKPIINSGKTLITIEPFFSQERRDASCGAITQITSSIEGERILCPELVYWWRMGKVIRLGGEYCGPYRIFDQGLPSHVNRAIELTMDRVNFNKFLILITG